MSTVIFNGRTSNSKPDEQLVVNRPSRTLTTVINGLVPYDVSINGIHRPPVLPGCVLNLPLWHPITGPTVFKSLDAYQHTNTVTGAVWTPLGRKFDGLDDQIVIPDNDVLSFTTTFSIEAWIKLKSAPAVRGGIVYKGGDDYILGVGSNRKLNTYTESAGGNAHRVANTAITLATWTYVGVSYDGSNLRFYLNGVPDGTVANTGAITDENLPLYIGSAQVASQFIDALIGECRVYSITLTTAQFLRSYNVTKWRYR